MRCVYHFRGWGAGCHGAFGCGDGEFGRGEEGGADGGESAGGFGCGGEGWRILKSLVEEEEGGCLEGMLRGLSVELVYEVSVECLDICKAVHN